MNMYDSDVPPLSSELSDLSELSELSVWSVSSVPCVSSVWPIHRLADSAVSSDTILRPPPLPLPPPCIHRRVRHRCAVSCKRWGRTHHTLGGGGQGTSHRHRRDWWPVNKTIKYKYEILRSRPFLFQNGAKSGFEMWLGPSTLEVEVNARRTAVNHQFKLTASHHALYFSVQNGANLNLRCVFGPSTLGARAKTRLLSRIMKFTPRCIYSWHRFRHCRRGGLEHRTGAC